jgi:hypothetical protein
MKGLLAIREPGTAAGVPRMMCFEVVAAAA